MKPNSKSAQKTNYVMNKMPNLDEYLEMVGLWRKLVPRDGRCLFRSIGEQLFGNQTIADELLSTCAAYLEKNSSKFMRHLSHPVDQYLNSARKAQTCAAHPHLDVFLEIVSSLYDCMIVVYHQASTQPTCVWTRPRHARTIELCKIGKHYDTVMTRERVSAFAQCQSLLFDLLYSQVFRMSDDEIEFGVSALRHKVNKRKDSVGECLGLESGDDSGHGGESNELSPNKMPFSYRAAKGLDINIFRNIAFDIWREENLDRASGEQLLIPGSQCIVQLPDKADSALLDSEAIIQDYNDETQIVSAFVQSLGMRVEVHRDAVRPLLERGPAGLALEARSSNKRRYGVKQDVHWHNRPDAHQKHLPPSVCWTGHVTAGGHPSEGGPGPERPAPTHSHGPHPRRYRDRGGSDAASQGQLMVQVSPGAFAAAAQHAGYPMSQVPSLVSSSPSRSEHPGCPQGAAKPLAKVFFNSVGKPAVCKLQLPRFAPRRAGAEEGGRTPGRTTPAQRHRCSSESAASALASPPAEGRAPEAAPAPGDCPPLMALPVAPQAPLLPLVSAPFVGNLPGPVDTAADFSKDALGRDLPQADPATLRYFFNLGVQYFRASLGQPVGVPVPPTPAPSWVPLQPPARSSPGPAPLRVVPLMDAEQPPPPPPPPVGSGMVLAGAGVFPASQPFSGSVYLPAAQHYYPLGPGLDGAPLMAPGGAGSAPEPQPQPQPAPGWAFPPPAYCYI